MKDKKINSLVKKTKNEAKDISTQVADMMDKISDNVEQVKKTSVANVKELKQKHHNKDLGDYVDEIKYEKDKLSLDTKYQLHKSKKQAKKIKKQATKKLEKNLKQLQKVSKKTKDNLNEVLEDTIIPKKDQLSKSINQIMSTQVIPAAKKTSAKTNQFINDEVVPKANDTKTKILTLFEEVLIPKANDLVENVSDSMKKEKDEEVLKLNQEEKQIAQELKYKLARQKDDVEEEVEEVSDKLKSKAKQTRNGLFAALGLATIAGATAFGVNTKVVEKRSVQSKLLELGLKSMDVKNKIGFVENDIEMNAAMLDNAKYYSTQPYLLPLKYKNKYSILDTNYDNVYLLENIEGHNDRLIIYFHAGMFWLNPDDEQYKYAASLADELNASVYIPIYPKAPTHNYQDVYNYLEQVYTKITNDQQNKDIIFVGNSNGGGLALGFAMYCKEKGLKLPSNIILNSPILDTKLDNPRIYEIEEYDPIQRPFDLKIRLRYYANHEDETNYLISPIYGDYKDIGLISIFSGTNDIFNADARVFLDKAMLAGVHINYFEYEYMIPCFMQYSIPEAFDAMNDIKKVLGLENEQEDEEE